MALFKKNALVKEVTESSVEKGIEPSPAAAKKQDKMRQEPSVLSGTWLLVLPSLLFAIVLFWLLDMLIFKPAEKQQYTSSNQLIVNTMRQQLDSALRQRIVQLQHFANNASLDQGASIEAQLKAVFPDIEKAFVFVSEQIPTLSQETSQVSFAGIDLVRKVAAGERVKIDAYFENKAWRYQLAAQLREGQGVLLAVFQIDELKRQFMLPADAQGQASVVATQGGRAMFSVGDAGQGAGAQLQLASSLSEWSVVFQAATEARSIFERTLIMLMIAVAAMLSALTVYMMAQTHLRRIKQALMATTQHLRSLANGEMSKSRETRFAEIAILNVSTAQAIRDLNKRAEEAKKKAQGAAAQPATPDASEDPLFDDELLDLDVLSESETDRDPLEQDLDAEEHSIVQEVAALDVDVSPSIFRAYDIRGVVGQTLNSKVVELIGKALASEALARGVDTLCVGYDGRLSSPDYCDAITQGILSTGVKVIVVGQVPTPVLYFATHHFKTGSGVMITGSHNPSNYNGFKMMLAGDTLANEDIQKLYNRIVLQDFARGQGELKEQSVVAAYLETIMNDIAVAAPLKVVVDAGNGVAGAIAPELIEELGCEVIPLYCEVDGNFPNHHPDPGKPENLQDLINAVREHEADIGLAFDGDGDRVGVVTNTGKIIWPDRLLMLFAKDVVSRNPGADIIFDVKCSRRLNNLITSFGGRPVMWKTGHSLIKKKMKETGALLAGEMSGHVFFKERWFGFDDGLYSAARLLEILGVEDRKADEVFASFPEDVSTPEINVTVTDESKFEIVEALCARKDAFAGGNVSTIDGLRVDFSNGWGLCRASNTTPVLVLRFEADDEAGLEQIKDRFKQQLLVVAPDLDLNF